MVKKIVVVCGDKKCSFSARCLKYNTIVEPDANVIVRFVPTLHNNKDTNYDCFQPIPTVTFPK